MQWGESILGAVVEKVQSHLDFDLECATARSNWSDELDGFQKAIKEMVPAHVLL